MKTASIENVLEWVLELHKACELELTDYEKKEQEKYAILVRRPQDKLLLAKMLDESSQIQDDKKLAERIKILIERYGIPEFFNSRDRLLLRLFTSIGYKFAPIAMPIFKKRLHSDTAGVIINEERPNLTKHLAQRHKDHIGQNVNLLGEVVLGDTEADHRYQHYLSSLEQSDINYISIKVSGIYAQLHPLNYIQAKEELCKRIAALYQKAMDYPFKEDNGTLTQKFINLDMEEYKDAELTLDVFKTVLSMPQFKNYRAGIVIQAYLADAGLFQDELLEFAKERVAHGGAPIKMRLVKGANLQMESVICSLRGWENPIRPNKIEVDANYLHLIDKAFIPENAKAVNIGIASHNLYTIGYAHLKSIEMGIADHVTFEMLEGMANHLCRAMRSIGKQIVLYTPVVKDEHFLNAVSYLVRRLDENTGKDNFLSYSFNLHPGNKEWNFLLEQFKTAYAMKDSMINEPTRTQNRNEQPSLIREENIFINEPDTIFDLKQNRIWVDSIVEKWKKSLQDKPIKLPVVIHGKQEQGSKTVKYVDHSQNEEVVTYEMQQASLEQVKQTIDAAHNDASGWRNTSVAERKKILFEVALNVSRRRGDLIGVASAVTGKTITEGDVEVSEAIDFCRFYPLSMETFDRLNTIETAPKGIVLVIPPWNFPIAIPIGGVVAALAGGNTVILKPATVAAPIAWEFAKCFWESGVPTDAFQVICPESGEPLSYLSTHPLIKHIILTGGTDTAFRLLETNPTCSLSAETGGKNAIILTEKGDRDHAIQNIITSAFSNSGQKCSACSLLLVEKGVYNDPSFKAKLRDATISLQVGSVWELNNVIGPMVTNNNDKLLHALEQMEPGEEWLVAPEFIDKAKYILKPCVKWGVKPSSYSFKNELFGPMLSVVCIDSLEEGIHLVNSGEYGLTSGLQSLDESEQSLWRENIEAGNLYINRGITGAIVNRQPFGGMKLSSFGGGIKAGGANYVTCFLNIRESSNSDELTPKTLKGRFEHIATILSESSLPRYSNAVSSYQTAFIDIFSKETDVNNLLGESNTFRYLPLKNILLRIEKEDKLEDIAMIFSASDIAQTPMKVSLSDVFEQSQEVKNMAETFGFPISIDSKDQFIEKMKSAERVRTCSANLPIEYYQEAAKSGLYIASAPPIYEGRLELLHYVKEQSISFEYHRYGSIPEVD